MRVPALRASGNVADVVSSTSKKSVKQSLEKAAVITAIKTPYLKSGLFDIEAFDAMVEEQISNGVEGLIIGGTTGEGHLMSWDEHIMLIAHCAITFGDRILVIGNTGSNSTREAVHASTQGFNVGMDAALHINPYYGKTSKEGLKAHFKVALECGPGIVYNVPSRTGQDIPDQVVHEIAQYSGFVGIKECTGNERIGNYAKKGIRCWSGNDDEAHDARHHFSANGVISVTSNLVPGLMSKLIKGEADPELNDSLQDLMSWLFCEPNPIAVNTALSMCGLVKPVFRLPYVPLTRTERETGVKLLEAVKEHIPGCKEIRVMDDSEFILLDRF